MSDRVSSLIADVQSRINPRDQLPGDAPDKWPAGGSLVGDQTVEGIDHLGGHSFESEAWADRGSRKDPGHAGMFDELEGLFTSQVFVDFPEDVDGTRVVQASKSPHGIDSVDALAFYLPFHFYRGWGIYIRESGLLQLAAEIEVMARGLGKPLSAGVLIDYAFRILWAHEFFHFRTEVACSRAQQLHWPYFVIYPPFFADRVASLEEEALANAFALANSKSNVRVAEFRIAKACARRWMKTLGPGYRDFARVEGGAHAVGKDSLVDRMVQIGGLGRSLLTPGRLFYREIGADRVPSYLVRDRGSVVSLVRNFPSYGQLRVWAYTNDHKPPHVHTGSGPGDKQSLRFEWPTRNNMDDAPARVVKQFNEYADRYGAEISRKVDRIEWK